MIKRRNVYTQLHPSEDRDWSQELQDIPFSRKEDKPDDIQQYYEKSPNLDEVFLSDPDEILDSKKDDDRGAIELGKLKYKVIHII
jgi:hypothetical protein